MFKSPSLSGGIRFSKIWKKGGGFRKSFKKWWGYQERGEDVFKRVNSF